MSIFNNIRTIARSVYGTKTYILVSLLLTLAVLSVFIAQISGIERDYFYILNAVAAVLFAFEILLEHFGDNQKVHKVKKYFHIFIDMIVIVSLLPILPESLLFLGSLRFFRLLSLYHKFIIKNRYFATYEYFLANLVYLIVFVFVVSSGVYSFLTTKAPIGNFSDAIYFTVSTISTTGYGDVVPVGAASQLFSVVMMLLGITLFLRLATSVSNPHKTHKPCRYCNTAYHDTDALNCKHCGTSLLPRKKR